jgi:hypothetical protein
MSAEGITVKVEGVDGLIERSAGLEAVILVGLAASLSTGAEVIMGRSKDEFVPVDTGALKSTGHVEKPEFIGTTVQVAMGYGGPSGVETADHKDYVGYALYVHEGTKHTAGRFYLERPAMEQASALVELVKTTVAGAIDKHIARYFKGGETL